MSALRSLNGPPLTDAIAAVSALVELSFPRLHRDGREALAGPSSPRARAFRGMKLLGEGAVVIRSSA